MAQKARKASTTCPNCYHSWQWHTEMGCVGDHALNPDCGCEFHAQAKHFNLAGTYEPAKPEESSHGQQESVYIS